MKTPDHDYYFNRLQLIFQHTLDKIESTRMISSFLQNPNIELTEPQIQEFWSMYIEGRNAVYGAVLKDIKELDDLMLEIITSIRQS